jgi:predicted dienelactone hydrolase
MFRDGIRATRAILRQTLNTTKAAGRTLGVDVESVQESIESLPLVKDTFSRAASLSHWVAPDKAPLYKQGAGPHQVGTHQQNFVDPTRGRKIPLTVYYPINEEKEAHSSPVVVFSHGLAGNSKTYRYLGRHWASHGYTVVQPTHVGSDTKAVLTKTPLGTFNRSELIDRTHDVSFALDKMESGELPEEVTRQADMNQVGLAGHSFGALTAEAMAGVNVKDGDKRLKLGDERVDAFVAISGYGDAFPSRLLGLDAGTYDQVDQPILFVAGEKDTLFTLGKGAEVHTEPFHQIATSEAGAVVVGGTRHNDFGQVFGYANKDAADLTRSSTLAFFDAQLKGDSRARSYLVDDLPKVAASWDSQAEYGKS